MLGKELKKQLSKEDFRSWLSNRRARSRVLMPSKVVKLRHKKRAKEAIYILTKNLIEYEKVYNNYFK